MAPAAPPKTRHHRAQGQTVEYTGRQQTRQKIFDDLFLVYVTPYTPTEPQADRQ